MALGPLSANLIAKECVRLFLSQLGNYSPRMYIDDRSCGYRAGDTLMVRSPSVFSFDPIPSVPWSVSSITESAFPVLLQQYFADTRVDFQTVFQPIDHFATVCGIPLVTMLVRSVLVGLPRLGPRSPLVTAAMVLPTLYEAAVRVVSKDFGLRFVMAHDIQTAMWNMRLDVLAGVLDPVYATGMGLKLMDALEAQAKRLRQAGVL